MIWAIVVVAIGVLGVAAWAGTGRLGEMPGTVIDRPKAHVPDGAVDEEFLEALSLPIAATGYRRSQVDAVLQAHVLQQDIEPGTRFDVVRRGYDMQAVDRVIERISAQEYGEEPGGVEATETIAIENEDVIAVPTNPSTTAEVNETPLSDDVPGVLGDGEMPTPEADFPPENPPEPATSGG